eukprot:70471-Prymnesium_polylepis.1
MSLQGGLPGLSLMPPGGCHAFLAPPDFAHLPPSTAGLGALPAEAHFWLAAHAEALQAAASAAGVTLQHQQLTAADAPLAAPLHSLPMAQPQLSLYRTVHVGTQASSTPTSAAMAPAAAPAAAPQQPHAFLPVSYTHLTLPTICSV